MQIRCILTKIGKKNNFIQELWHVLLCMSFFFSIFAHFCAHMVKLSIVTINRNNASGLRKTMESVFSQTYRDFEYIVIDGASTDGSVDVIKELAEKITFPSGRDRVGSFNWLSEPDSGVYQAMNKGIKKAKGEYLLFLNSGDFLIAPDVLERVFASSPFADILCCRCNVSDSNKVVWSSNPPRHVTFGTLYIVGLAHQSTFIKRALFDKYGLYREDFKYNSDIAFWYKAIIDNHASTQTIDIVTTDYNLEGISSKECNSAQYNHEKEEILHPYNRFTPDYKAWQQERKILDKYQWLERHNLIQRCLALCYKVLKRINCL